MDKKELESKLWQTADELRHSMDASEYKNYILGFIFFKYLSDQVEDEYKKIAKEENITIEKLVSDEELYNEVKLHLVEKFGYSLEPDYFFSKFVEQSRSSDETLIINVQKALSSIESSAINTESEEDLIGLFSDIDFNATKLGSSVREKSLLVGKVFMKLSELGDFSMESDLLGDAYEYLLKQFASSAGKKGGEFYTPGEISKILAKIAIGEKDKITSVYDPTCGSASLLLKMISTIKEKNGKIFDIYGQEINITTFNLARMNMFLHGIPYNKFHIKQGDTIENPKHLEKKFEAIVANPPFGTNWNARDEMLKDDRFAKYGKLAPKSKAEMAFIQHMLYHLADDGVMASVAPHGVLFRGAAEKQIRQYIIEKDNYLDAVIGLPANLFYGTSIPACILVFKKCREDDKILFIDASGEFKKEKNQNVLLDEHINRIYEIYEQREVVLKTDEVDLKIYSSLVGIEEIIANDFNLNIPRYVDTFEEEEPIDLHVVSANITKVKTELEQLELEINSMLEELVDENGNKINLKIG